MLKRLALTEFPSQTREGSVAHTPGSGGKTTVVYKKKKQNTSCASSSLSVIWLILSSDQYCNSNKTNYGSPKRSLQQSVVVQQERSQVLI